VDIKPYQGGWLINSVEYLSVDITDDDVRRMEKALAGEIDDSVLLKENDDLREVLLWSAKRFHFVHETFHKSKEDRIRYYACDCRDYYFKRWCFQSAYMQHRHDLGLLSKKIPNCRKGCTKKDNQAYISEVLSQAKSRAQKRRDQAKMDAERAKP
jgi:hypothetical protein